MTPTKEEDKFSNYTGDTSELGLGERFIKEILDLPLSFERVEAILYKETFDDEVLHLRKSFGMIKDASTELKSSHLFLKLLEVVLKTGNRFRGDAKAFRLDALLKLADVKGTDGRTTLLHFVQEMNRLEATHTDEKMHSRYYLGNEACRKITGLDLISGLTTELTNVKKAAGVDLDVLATSVLNLSEVRLKLAKLIKDDQIYGNGEKFMELMAHFLNHAEKEIKRLEQEKGHVLQMVKQITEYFHGGMSKDEANPLRLFVIVSDFLSMLDQVCKDIRRMKAINSGLKTPKKEKLPLYFNGRG